MRTLARLLCGLVLVAGLTVAMESPAMAACRGGASLYGAKTDCYVPPAKIRDIFNEQSGQPPRLRPQCGLGGRDICHQRQRCRVGGENGYVYDVLQGGRKIGSTCLTESEAEELGQVTPGMVLAAFRRLSWPSSDLIVQPPDGRTLVNFDTNFRTDNDQPTTQRVTLLGQRIVIEATPSEYVWSFGDGDTEKTESPGAAYPDLEITHNYLRKGEYAPSVDTVYSGRYRVNGGAWQSIPGTVTVPGSSVALRAIEASPVLVDPYR